MNYTQQHLTPYTLEDPDVVLDYLSPVIRAVYAALDHGFSLADTKMSDMEPDSCLWSHLVRHDARGQLAKTQGDGWTVDRKLANSGIEITCGPLVVKVLKSRNGGPPHAASSQRKDFYSQLTLPNFPLEVMGTVLPPGPNFILDWSADAQRHAEMALSKPREAWGFEGVRKLAWRRPIMDMPGEELRFTATEDRDITIESVIEADELEGMDAVQ